MERKFDFLSLSGKIVAVAIEGHISDWAAYIDTVPGKCHYDEARLVAEEGTKLPQKVAEALFPEFAKKFIWRA